jgi:hypothetical protein
MLEAGLEVVIIVGLLLEGTGFSGPGALFL